ncbi:hypothetical protein QOT17_003127 [Balamuthia mandrillaris]
MAVEPSVIPSTATFEEEEAWEAFFEERIGSPRLKEKEPERVSRLRSSTNPSPSLSPSCSSADILALTEQAEQRHQQEADDILHLNETNSPYSPRHSTMVSPLQQEIWKTDLYYSSNLLPSVSSPLFRSASNLQSSSSSSTKLFGEERRRKKSDSCVVFYSKKERQAHELWLKEQQKKRAEQLKQMQKQRDRELKQKEKENKERLQQEKKKKKKAKKITTTNAAVQAENKATQEAVPLGTSPTKKAFDGSRKSHSFVQGMWEDNRRKANEEWLRKRNSKSFYDPTGTPADSPSSSFEEAAKENQLQDKVIETTENDAQRWRELESMLTAQAQQAPEAAEGRRRSIFIRRRNTLSVFLPSS